MHYSEHRLTASVACVTTLTYASTSSQGADHVLSVQFSSVASLCTLFLKKLVTTISKNTAIFCCTVKVCLYWL